MTKQGYFLGANSGDGFSSLYGGFSAEMKRLYVLKGGAGSGKSSFMRRVLENIGNSGEKAELVFCSGDPDSLDGVYFQALDTAIVDGTAPHILEPGCVGYSKYIDLGAFTSDLPDGISEQLLSLKRENSRAYAGAYRFLRASQSVSEELRAYYDSEAEHRVKRAQGIASRVLGKGTGQKGTVRERFLDAVTCRGVIHLPPSCEHLYAMDGEYGVSDEAMRVFAAEAVERGYAVTVCRDPLSPSRFRHVIVEELSLAFVTSGDSVSGAERHIRLDAPDHIPKEKRAEMRLLKRMVASSTELAVHRLAEAKTLHDEMERFVNPYVDFDSALSLADALSEKLAAMR